MGTSRALCWALCLLAVQLAAGQLGRARGGFARQAILSNEDSDECNEAADDCGQAPRASEVSSGLRVGGAKVGDESLATTTSKPASLITRASDAILRSLSDYFSHDSDFERLSGSKEEDKLDRTTTSLPLPSTTTGEPKSVSPAPSTVGKRTTTPKAGPAAANSTRAPSSKASSVTERPAAGTAGQASPKSLPATNPTMTTTTTTTTTKRPPERAAAASTSPPRSGWPGPTVQPHLDLNSYRDEPHPPSTSTRRPRAPARTGELHPTPPTLGGRANSSLAPTGAARPLVGENSIEFFSFLNRAFDSIYSLNQLTYLNRTTRLAHENETGGGGGGSTVSLLPSGAHEREDETNEEPAPEATEGVPGRQASKLQQQQQQQQQQRTATRDDIMLLCKLLHKQLENGSIVSANGTFLTPNGTNLLLEAPGPSSQKQLRTSTTARPRDLLREFMSSGLLVGDPQQDLNESHDGHLLESIFSLESRTTTGGESAHEEAGRALLADLFNAGFRRRFASQLNSSAELGQLMRVGPLAKWGLAPLQLRLWSKTITGGRGGRLKLIYWLVLPASESVGSKFKVLDADEANELLDRLEHATIQRALDETPLVKPLVLAAPYRRPSASGDGDPTAEDELLKAVSPPSPHVVDDKLDETAKSPVGDTGRWRIQTLVERLLTTPFSENLHLYLVLLLILLFLIIMCFALPMICCRPCGAFGGRSESSSMLAANSTSGRFSGQRSQGDDNGQANLQAPRPSAGEPMAPCGKRVRSARGTKSRKGKQSLVAGGNGGEKRLPSISGALRGGPAYVPADERDQMDDFEPGRTSGTINEAVWTKLSNSTTTLTKDRVRTMYDDGQVSIPVLRQRDSIGGQEPGGDLGPARLKRFEWYTFEDTTRFEKAGEAGRPAGGGGALRDQQSQTSAEQMRMTKSVQTQQGGPEAEAEGPPMNLTFSERLETRNSDTLTKSELVMLKEKLIPIGRQQLVAARDEGGERDEVRELARPNHDYVNQPTRHIDSSIDDSANGQSRSLRDPAPPNKPAEPVGSTQLPMAVQGGDQRAPSMRYLELPSKAAGRVEAIRSELERVEARDSVPRRQQTSAEHQRPTGANGGARERAGGGAATSYKRYDVI